MGTSSPNLPSESSAVHDADWKQEPDWKQEVNERVAAHRTRRGKAVGAQTTLPLELDEKPARSRARVAARVAARYANTPSYSDVLATLQAAECSATEREATPAEGTATQALLSAPLLSGLAAEPVVAGPPASAAASEGKAQQAGMKDGTEAKGAAGGNPDSATRNSPSTNSLSRNSASNDPSSLGMVAAAPLLPVKPDSASGAGLRVEDAGKFAESAGGEEFIPGNLIEFPRVLVAARKARPRLAEGPLREDATVDTDPEHSQLRIFEVEQQAISTTAQVDPVATEWSSIRLDAQPRLDKQSPLDARADLETRRGVSATVSAGTTPAVALPQSAPISDRLMAVLVDGTLVGLAFLAFVAVFVACTAHPPTGKPALVAAGVTLAAFFLLYQFLFFSFGEGTPGMRYAHIALCTFDDENPTREQLRRRIGALLLSACPLALGFAWALFDEDHLGWHDRISRTYQRSYR